MTFILGCAVGAVVVLLCTWQRRGHVPTDETTQALSRKTAREYRNFMTYDGFTEQEGYDE